MSNNLAKVEIVEEGVTLEGKDVPVGTILTLPEDCVESLIESKHGKAVTAETPAPETPPIDPVSDTKDVEEERAKIAKALDAKYNKPELVKEAQVAGVEFEFNAQKPEIIEAVIVQGKAEVLLSKED